MDQDGLLDLEVVVTCRRQKNSHSKGVVGFQLQELERGPGPV